MKIIFLIYFEWFVPNHLEQQNMCIQMSLYAYIYIHIYEYTYTQFCKIALSFTSDRQHKEDCLLPGIWWSNIEQLRKENEKVEDVGRVIIFRAWASEEISQHVDDYPRNTKCQKERESACEVSQASCPVIAKGVISCTCLRTAV